jgi:hypothetical protein
MACEKSPVAGNPWDVSVTITLAVNKRRDAVLQPNEPTSTTLKLPEATNGFSRARTTHRQAKGQMS